MTVKKIYINPGHSDLDPGAVGYEIERKLNVKVSGFMNEHLLANYVCQTRMNPGSVNSTAQVAADANAWGADLMVSNHFNAGGGDGYEALVYSAARVALGKVFEKHVLAAGQNSRGVKLRPELSILRRTQMPAVLNEGAFVDNKADIDGWNEEAELKKLGIAYAEAAAEFLNLEKLPRDEESFLVQIGTFSSREEAEALRKRLEAAGFAGRVVQAK
jgi:N-acetylmuramoyl-L-alanine amidase